jgi:hypothetical protein
MNTKWWIYMWLGMLVYFALMILVMRKLLLS